MIFSQLLSLSLVSVVLSNPIGSIFRRPNVLMTNDDGWAVAQIRSEFDTLDATRKYNMILSCPAVDKSGTANTTATPAITTAPCEFNTCPVGAPAVGHDARDPRLNYVNAFPVDAVSVGVDTLAPKFFHGQKPDFVVAGSNLGNNLGPIVQISGTCHAAAEAVKLGIPALAFSGNSGAFVSYTTLKTDPTANSTIAAEIYNKLTLRMVETVLDPFSFPFPFNLNKGGNNKHSDILPEGVVVSVNYPSIANCPRAEDYKWVFTRVLPATEDTKDVEICENHGKLTDEATAIKVPGCWVTVSVFGAVSVSDVDAKTQKAVVDKIRPLLSCQPKN